MVPVIDGLVFRAAQDMDSLPVQVDQCQIFRVVACGAAGEGLMVHRYPVPFEIRIVFYLLHGGGVFPPVPIVSAHDPEVFLRLKARALPVQGQVLVLQCVGKAHALRRLELDGQDFQAVAFQGGAGESLVHIDVQHIVLHQVVQEAGHGHFRLSVRVHCLQDEKLPGA